MPAAPFRTNSLLHQPTPVTTSDRDDFVSTTSEWYRAWLSAFGGSTSGIWRDRANSVEIPYVRGTAAVGPLRLATAAAAANSHTPHFDALGKLEGGSALRGMMHDLGVAMLTFPYLAEGSQLLRAERTPRNGLLYDISFCEAAPYVDCSGSWDEYWKSRGSSRTEWGRRERRMMQDQKATFECHTSWPEIEKRFRDILAVEASGWKGEQRSAIIQNPDVLAFYTDMAKYWAQRNELRLFVLYIEDKPVAFELDVEYRGRLNCVKHGYDDNLAKQGPGLVLRILVLKWAFARPEVQLFDMFGPVSEPKLKWATGVEKLHTLRVFRRSPAGYLAWLRFAKLPQLRHGDLKVPVKEPIPPGSMPAAKAEASPSGR